MEDLKLMVLMFHWQNMHLLVSVVMLYVQSIGQISIRLFTSSASVTLWDMFPESVLLEFSVSLF